LVTAALLSGERGGSLPKASERGVPMEYTKEHMSAFLCADCGDESDEDGDEAYFILVSEDTQVCPLDHCPKCGSYLSFVPWGKWLVQDEDMLSWVAKQKEQGGGTLPSE
jgi:hypothetical protein